MTKEPAFPTGIFTDDKGVIIGGSYGMTLRDYFAAKAMQGILSDENFHYAAWDNSLDWVEHVANYSYEMADAMLKARGND